MKKVLIITSSIDYTVDYIISKYGNKYKFYRLNVDMFNKYVINVSYENGFYIKNKQWTILEEEIDAIYYRKPILPDLSDYESKYRNMISRDIITVINGIVDAFKGVVLSRPSLLKKSENKVFQMRIANQVGFNFPKSLIGTSNTDINNIIDFDGIIKPLTIGKIINGDKCEIIQTCKIEEHINEDIALTPLYVQQYIDKNYEVRVTIVDDEIFAVKIMAFNKIDWRIDQSNNRYELISIPKDIKEKCLKMMDIMNLKFGAFDFIVDKNENYIFLEVNPNGQWLWLEKLLGLKISNRIINYLSKGDDED